MRYKISKAFKKQVSKINDPKILSKVRKTIEQIDSAASLADIQNLEPLTGFPSYYRIRFDYRYRIGIYCDSDVVEVLVVGSREGFYKGFP
jgi:mRNA-degrading endonuclease RelE of RelBE toxin-antitoxin system